MRQLRTLTKMPLAQAARRRGPHWSTYRTRSLATLSEKEFTALAQQVLEAQTEDRQRNQLHYYRPANDTAGRIHTTLAKTIGIGGGNGAGKTDHALVELVIRATGQIPAALQATYPREKLRGPIAGRVVCESLTTTLVPTILPKLQWWRWSGFGRPGSDQGHWGWIPQSCLIDGEWKHSWTERLRVLRVLYRDPDQPSKVLGESTIQFMSYDIDPTDFASGDFHFVLHDEPPKWEIWRENRARVMRVDGTMVVAMTWPDNPAIPVDWIFDELYDKGQEGPNRDPSVEWINIFTTDNPHLNQASVGERAAQMSEMERAVRIYGQPIRFSNRIHPLFTDAARTWCFRCAREVITVEGLCTGCQSDDVTPFCHVTSCPADRSWPVIFALDPHPRKPHMMTWIQLTPNDDLQQVAELEIEGGPEAVRDAVQEIESLYGWSTIWRLIDPNMGRSPSGAKRELTWQDEFETVGLRCDLADDSDVGRARLNEYLVPDRQIGSPRFLTDSRCTTTHFQLKRYTWDEHRRQNERDLKQKAREKYDDYPTLLKYVLNFNPSFRLLKSGGGIIRREGVKRGLY